MFKTPKHVPKWAWWAASGAGAIGAVYMIKNRNASAPADSTQNADSSGAIGYTDAQNMPGIVVQPAAPMATADDGSGALGSLYLGALGDLFSGLQQQNSELLSAVLSTGGGASGSTDNTGGVVTPPPTTGTSVAPAPSPSPSPSPTPAPAPAPAPSDPCTGMQSGGSAGNCSPAGAICRQMLKCNQNSNGHYCVWKFRFKDGHSNCYSNYTSGSKAGQCVGPYGCP